MKIKEIPQIPGAFARGDGYIKWPRRVVRMPNGGQRTYETKWIKGSEMRSHKRAKHKYMGVVYRKKNYKIHQLICAAFHGPRPNGNSVVIHLNEDATDNRPENLRWGTQKENLNMPGFLKYCRGRTGENNPFVKGRRVKGQENIERSNDHG